MEECPFPDLKIDPADFLDSLSGRSKCPKCRRSRKYYCYTCFIPVTEIADSVPKLKLPIKVDIIKHPSECDGKSTAIHAGVICPGDVTILTYPCIPDYCKEKTLVVFPGDDSVTLEELADKLKIDKQFSKSPMEVSVQTKKDIRKSKRMETESKLNGSSGNENYRAEQSGVGESDNIEMDKSVESEKRKQPVQLTSDDNVEASTARDISEINGKDVDECDDETDIENLKSNDPVNNDQNNGTSTEGDTKTFPFDKVVFIDSTWNQTKSVCNDERLKGLKRIELKTRLTKFWRHQDDVPDTYLSTIEAIYYFMRDFHENFIRTGYNGEYDNLLFFFTFMYRKIRTIYDGGEELRAYKKRKMTQN